MAKVTFNERPEYLQKFLKLIRESQHDPKKTAKGVILLEAMWEGYHREAQYFLDQLADHSITLEPTIEHYRAKWRYLAEEKTWLKATQRSLPMKIKAELEHNQYLRKLNSAIDKRESQIHKVAFPDFPYIPRSYPPNLQAITTEADTIVFNSAKETGEQISEGVSQLFRGYRSRYVKRWLYRNLVERIWGLIIIGLLFEQWGLKYVEDRLPEAMVRWLAVPVYWRIIFGGLLFVLVFELKKYLLDPFLHKLFTRLHRKHLVYDILDAAELQTSFQTYYLLIDLVETHEEQEEEAPAKHAEQHPPQPATEPIKGG
jgi:hypothetical protein